MTRKTTPRRPPPTCVFRKGFATEEIDPRVDKLWRATFGSSTPFGDLRNMWRQKHCRLLNPYGDSDLCPFTEEECGLAFLSAVQTTCRARPRVPVGYFIKIAASLGSKRADDAVELKAEAARIRRTDVRPEEDEALPSPWENLDTF